MSDAAQDRRFLTGIELTSATNAYKGRCDLDLPFADLCRLDIVFDTDVLLTVVARCSHGVCLKEVCHCGITAGGKSVMPKTSNTVTANRTWAYRLRQDLPLSHQELYQPRHLS